MPTTQLTAPAGTRPPVARLNHASDQPRSSPARRSSVTTSATSAAGSAVRNASFQLMTFGPPVRADIIHSMPKTTPDHHDAELLIQVYDLRREPVMRESRRAIQRDFWPKTWADLEAVLSAEHPLNAPYRQTGTYWEMVYSMVRHGIVHPGFWLENNGEGMFLYVKVEQFLE